MILGVSLLCGVAKEKSGDSVALVSFWSLRVLFR